MRALLRNLVLNTLGSISTIQNTTHILNLHYITPHELKNDHEAIFEDFLIFITKNCKLISIEQALDNMKSKKDFYDKPEIALTFDDGFEECYTIIAPLIEKYGGLGTFFVCGSYIENLPGYQEQFNSRTLIYSKAPMNWDQLKDLKARGHTIGSHTKDHQNLARLKVSDAHSQIIENKALLESRLEYVCEYFAWPYGWIKDYPSAVHDFVKHQHAHIFSGANYKYFFTDQQIINRRHIEPFWNHRHIKYFLSHKKGYSKNIMIYNK